MSSNVAHFCPIWNNAVCGVSFALCVHTGCLHVLLQRCLVKSASSNKAVSSAVGHIVLDLCVYGKLIFHHGQCPQKTDRIFSLNTRSTEILHSSDSQSRKPAPYDSGLTVASTRQHMLMVQDYHVSQLYQEIEPQQRGHAKTETFATVLSNFVNGTLLVVFHLYTNLCYAGFFCLLLFIRFKVFSHVQY